MGKRTTPLLVTACDWRGEAVENGNKKHKN